MTSRHGPGLLVTAVYVEFTRCMYQFRKLRRTEYLNVVAVLIEDVEIPVSVPTILVG